MWSQSPLSIFEVEAGLVKPGDTVLWRADVYDNGEQVGYVEAVVEVVHINSNFQCTVRVLSISSVRGKNTFTVGNTYHAWYSDLFKSSAPGERSE